MSLNLFVLLIVVVVWLLGVVISIWAQPGKNGTSGGLGAFILIWMVVLTFSLAALVGWGLTFIFSGVAYLLALMAFVIFWVWFWNR